MDIFSHSFRSII